MRYGAGVAFGISVLAWWLMKDSSPLLNAASMFAAAAFGTLTVLFYLRHTYRRRPRRPLGPCLIAVAVACVVAFSMSNWAADGVANDKPAASAGSATVMVTGATSGDTSRLWLAHREVSIASDGHGSTTATVTVAPTSSRPDLDVMITLADDSRVLCESEDTADWMLTAVGVKAEAPCDGFISVANLKSLRRAVISESRGVGRLYNGATNPTFETERPNRPPLRVP